MKNRYQGISNSHISIPNDGPLLFCSSLDDVQQLQHQNDILAVKDALDAINYSKNYASDGSDISKVEEICYRLLQDLLPSSSEVRHQLKALQAFRSNLLNLTKARQEEQFTTANSNNLLKGIYRLLLEQALSAGTPTGMRRAIASCLDSMKAWLSSREETKSFHLSLHRSVTESIFYDSDKKYWKDPLQSLFEVCNMSLMKSSLELYEPKLLSEAGCTLNITQLMLQEGSQIQPCFQQYEDDSKRDQAFILASEDISSAMNQASKISSIFKLVFPFFQKRLQSLSTLGLQTTKIRVLEGLSQLEKEILYPVLSSAVTNGDVLSATGAALSQILLLSWSYNVGFSSQEDCTNHITRKIYEKVSDAFESLPSLNFLALLRGLAATSPQSVLLSSCPSQNTCDLEHDIMLINPFSIYLLRLARSATDATTQLSALKGLDTILSRLHRILSNYVSTCFESAQTSDIPVPIASRSCEYILEEILVVVFHAWESIVSRSITGSAADLFANIMKILQLSKDAIQNTITKDTKPWMFKLDLDHLVRSVLAQPDNRKGKYVALDIMLPLIGAKRLIEDSNKVSSGNLVTTLIQNMGGDERGQNKNSGAISEFLRKLLLKLFHEMNGDNEISSKENKRDRRRKERKAKKDVQAGIKLAHEIQEPLSNLPKEWIDVWVHPLASALLSMSENRRKQTAAFCLPLLSDIAGSRAEAPYVYRALLIEVDKQWRESNKDEKKNHEQLEESNLWSKLELAKHASSQKLMKTSRILQKLLVELIPLSLLKMAMIHSKSSIRLVGFSTTNAIVSSHFFSSSNYLIIRKEVDLWISTLPYACKCNEKEYVFKILQHLTDLLQRVAIAENEMIQSEQKNSLKSRSLLTSFVCDFLILDLFCKQASYPGTAQEKEQFILSLLRCIVAFISASYPYYVAIQSQGQKSQRAGNTGKKLPTKRRVSEFQVSASNKILRVLLSENTFSTLISLQNSMWDRTRSTASALSCDLLHLGFYVKKYENEEITFPKYLRSSKGRNSLYARSLHLASSPRQRESDTGARILSILYSSSLPIERGPFLKDLLNVLEKRLHIMQQSLGVVHSNVSSNMKNKSYEKEKKIEVETANLPLAHGLIQAVCLSVEYAKEDSFPVDLNALSTKDSETKESVLLELYEKIIKVCCDSIKTSLAVVADLKRSGTQNNNADEPGKSQSCSTPLNVNTGAIGANAVFASIKSISKDDEVKRTSIQRIIIGSWLLTKEACAALAATIMTSPVPLSFDALSSSGSLLLQTLSSLKHQGAAFAAHKALEKICCVCVKFRSKGNLTNSPHTLPSLWAQDLLSEISMKEKVRDSTLRRSTGIALGFLSIMRSEPPANVKPTSICPFVLSNLLKLSLPPTSSLYTRFKKLNMTSPEDSFIFQNYMKDPEVLFVEDAAYQVRTRVHALNILRLSILDAPLATEMRKFVGDAIISALIGYKDDSWQVRNSATMVFSAAMLRVVDADKNASSSEHKATHTPTKTVLGSANAVTARELFQTYASLSPFLVAALKESMLRTSNHSVHPSLYPILLLLSRLQPASNSEDDKLTQNLIDPFVVPVLECLGHVQHKIRVMASRALSKLCTGDGGAINVRSSRRSLLNSCEIILRDNLSSNSNWNKLHGAMLTTSILLQGCRDISLYLGGDSTLCPLLLRLASWKIISFPPPISAVALETIFNALLTGKLLKGFDRVFFQNIVWDTLKEIESFNQIQEEIGLSALARIVSEISVHFSYEIIFDLKNTNEKQRNEHLEKLRSLFQSSCFDIRFTAIKAFKKPLVQSMDNMIFNTTVDAKSRSRISSSISQILTMALWLEFQRDRPDKTVLISSDEDGLGYHAPSLRRISRCLIEVLTVSKTITGNVVYPIGESLSFDENWDMLIGLRESGGAKQSEFGIDEDNESESGNILSGNAIELMGFAISSSAEMSNFQMDSDLLSKVEAFVAATKHATNPLSVWVLRHSTAVAIRISGILNWSAKEFNIRAPKEEEKLNVLEGYRCDLYMQALHLLQDNDPDVRHAAVQALREARSSSNPNENTASNSLSLNLIPSSLLVLEESYLDLINSFSHKLLCERLLKQLLKSSKNVEENMNFVVDEFSNSEKVLEGETKSLSTILNLNMERRIFENEDPNPYEENLVLIQLAMCTIVRLNGNLQLPKDMLKETLERGKFVLDIFYQRKCSDIAHEVTWSINTFIDIFATIAACACVVFVQGVDDESLNIFNIVEETEKLILHLEKEGKHDVIHPCIWNLLQALSTASSNDPDTRKNISNCSFLLNRGDD